MCLDIHYKLLVPIMLMGVASFLRMLLGWRLFLISIASRTFLSTVLPDTTRIWTHCPVCHWDFSFPIFGGKKFCLHKKDNPGQLSIGNVSRVYSLRDAQSHQDRSHRIGVEFHIHKQVHGMHHHSSTYIPHIPLKLQTLVIISSIKATHFCDVVVLSVFIYHLEISCSYRS